MLQSKAHQNPFYVHFEHVLLLSLPSWIRHQMNRRRDRIRSCISRYHPILPAIEYFIDRKAKHPPFSQCGQFMRAENVVSFHPIPSHPIPYHHPIISLSYPFPLSLPLRLSTALPPQILLDNHLVPYSSLMSYLTTPSPAPRSPTSRPLPLAWAGIVFPVQPGQVSCCSASAVLSGPICMYVNRCRVLCERASITLGFL